MKFYICEIAKRQYLLEEGEGLTIENLASPEKFLLAKILLAVDEEKVEVGTPYLSKDLNLEILGTSKGLKIRVATYKAKANNRRVIGSRRIVSKVKLIVPVKKELPKKVIRKVVKKGT